MASKDSLISSAAKYIFDTFEVSEEQAYKHAEGIASLVDAKGGDINNFNSLTFNNLITKQLADKYSWKDEAAKEKWETNKKASIKSYNSYINSRKKGVYK